MNETAERSESAPVSAAEQAAQTPRVAPPPISEAQADGASPETDAVPPPRTPAQAGQTAAVPATADAATPPAAAPPKPRPKGAYLYRAFRAKRPVEGRIESVIKGGYEVKLGKARGFCPHSQIDLHRVDDPQAQVGRLYRFRIMQLRRGGEDVVLSRRALLEDERREEAAAVRATLIEGAVMQGRVTGTADFGAFVDLGAGVMGLVHITELAHRRVTRVDQVVRVGDTVPVKVLKIDASRGRISLSMRQAVQDPWADVGARFQPGQVYPGKVSRIADFGAFVELAQGVEALAPVSELPPATGGWKERFERGEQERWLVLSVDSKQRRISVTPPVDGFETLVSEAPAAGQTLRGKVQRHERFGVFVWLGPGRVGLMPNAWTGVPRGQDPAQRLPVGEEVEVEVAEVSDKGRLRLRRAGLAPRTAPRRKRSDERSPAPAKARTNGKDGPAAPAAAPAEGSFGSILGDKLKAALGQAENRSG